jgi:hypothetical protein
MINTVIGTTSIITVTAAAVPVRGMPPATIWLKA